jgi:hypothetical protein
VLVVRRENTVAHPRGERDLVRVVRVDRGRGEDTRRASLKLDLAALVEDPVEDVF